MQNWFVMAGVAGALCLGANNGLAQANGGAGQGGGRGNRGNIDPAQRQQFMMDRYKEILEVTDDAEWKALQPLVLKVSEARFQGMAGMGRGMFGRNRGGGNGGDPGGGGGQGGQGGGRGGMFGAPSPEAEALQKAIDAKAPKAELKAALEKYVVSRKAKQAELESAQAELRKVLTARQEAIATLNGLLGAN
jgi:hypothetical protein